MVPGENSCSEEVKSKMNSQNVKIFSDSNVKGIRNTQFNQFIKTGNARIHSFLRANLRQLLRYLNVNLESTTDTVILHNGINDLLKDTSIDNFYKFHEKSLNNVVSESCKNEDMYNASNLNNPCDTFLYQTN